MSDKSFEPIEVLVLVGMAFIFGVVSGCNGGASMIRREAIEHNVAEWTVAPRTGATKFEWKGSR